MGTLLFYWFPLSFPLNEILFSSLAALSANQAITAAFVRMSSRAKRSYLSIAV